jgi:hypothetical protein
MLPERRHVHCSSHTAFKKTVPELDSNSYSNCIWRIPCRLSCRCGNWLGDSPKQQLERYAARNHHWVKALQDAEPLNLSITSAAAAAAVDGPAGDETAADLTPAGIEGFAHDQGSGILWSLSVLDATVPCSSTAGFNCQAQLRVQPMAAAAAAATAAGSGEMSSIYNLLGLDNAAAAAAAFEVRCDTAAGAGLAAARLEMQEDTGRLLVVAGSGGCGGWCHMFDVFSQLMSHTNTTGKLGIASLLTSNK